MINAKKQTGLPSFWQPGLRRIHNNIAPSPPSRPQAKRRCVSISGSGAYSPSGSPEGRALWCRPHRTPPRRGAGVQRAEPSGAVRIGRLPGEGRESRGQSPLVPAAEAKLDGVDVYHLAVLNLNVTLQAAQQRIRRVHGGQAGNRTLYRRTPDVYRPQLRMSPLYR